MPWGDPGDDADRAERRNGNGRRQRAELDAHDDDAYAHGRLVDRLLEGAAPIRVDYDRRLRSVERVVGQVVVVAVVLGLVLGGIAGAVVARLLR